MAPAGGAFIVLEGLQESGRSAQFELLKERLKKAGYDTLVFNFPDYGRGSSYFAKKYLSGGYGPLNSVSPYAASLFFALDRFEAAREIQGALEQGKVVIANGFSGSNMATQGAKFSDTIQKRSFFVWEDSLEFQLLGVPRPSINIYLRSQPSEEAKKVAETYEQLCELFPRDFKAINCYEDGRQLDINTISDRIWQIASEFLPYLPEAKEAPAAAEETAVEEVIEGEPETEDEIAPPAKSTDVREVAIKLEEISLLAIYEMLRLNLPVAFDISKVWKGKSKKFYSPPGLSSANKARYEQAMSLAAANRDKILPRLREYYQRNGLSEAEADKKAGSIVRSLLPSAAYASASFTLDKDNYWDILNSLRGSRNLELRDVYQKCLRALPADWPKASEATAKEVPSSVSEILKQLSQAAQPHEIDVESGVSVLSANPRNEFDLLAQTLYNYGNLGRAEISDELNKWPYDKKAKALTSSITESKGRILQEVSYAMDGLSSRLALISALKNHVFQSPKLQPATPRYGYGVPAAIDDAGLENEFMDVFDSFLDLYSQLQSHHDNPFNEYATLSGHKMRWQANVAADKLYEASRKGQNGFIRELIEKVKEAHPIIGNVIQLKDEPAKPKPRPKRRGGRGRKNKAR